MSAEQITLGTIEIRWYSIIRFDVYGKLAIAATTKTAMQLPYEI